MLLLEDQNLIIQSKLTNVITGNQRELFDISFSDFGKARCRLYSASDKINLILSISLPSIKELDRFGLFDYLQQSFGESIKIINSEKGYDLSVQFLTSNLSGTFLLLDRISYGQFLESLIKELSLLRRNILALPLKLAISAQEAGKKSDMMKVPLHGDDVMYVQGNTDRITIVLETKFDDPSDIVLGKVFMQEFYDTRTQISLQNTPSVLYGKEPPKEVKSLIPAVHNDHKKQEKAISLIINFRDYFHYHIKCCKAFLHNRMRAKVGDFLKMLNRTKPLSK